MASMPATFFTTMLGTDFPYSDFPAQESQGHPGGQPRRTSGPAARRSTLGISGHVRETLDALMPRLSRREDRSFLDEVLDAHEVAAKDMQAYVGRGGKPGVIRPEMVAADVVNRLADPNAIFTADNTGDELRVGRAVLDVPSRPAFPGFVRPRHDGQRDAAGDWRPAGVSRSAGDRPVRRRRAHDVARRSADHRGPEAPYQARAVRQLVARHGARGG